MNEIPTSIELVNNALIESGLEAEFPLQHKSLLILIVDCAMQKGYVSGYKDCAKGLPMKAKNYDVADKLRKARGRF